MSRVYISSACQLMSDENKFHVNDRIMIFHIEKAFWQENNWTEFKFISLMKIAYFNFSP